MVTAEDIRIARDRTGESQAKFAQRFGVDQSTVHRWETEGPPDRGAAAVLIERVLGEVRTEGSPRSRAHSGARA